MSNKTTIYLDPQVKKFLRHKSIEECTSMSNIINSYFEDMLQDLGDIQTITKRRKETTISFEQTLADAGLTYADLQD